MELSSQISNQRISHIKLERVVPEPGIDVPVNARAALETIMHLGPMGFVLVSAEGTLVYVSPSATRVLGYMVDQVAGQPVLDLVHPKDRVQVLRKIGRIWKTAGGSAAFLFRSRHEDGSWRWLEAAAVNLLADPEVGALAIQFRDVTERIFGWRAEEVLGELPRFFLDANQTSCRQRLPRANYEGMVTNIETRQVSQDGLELDANLAATALRDSAAQAPRFVCMLEDITERRRAEAAIYALNLEFEERVLQRTAELQALNQELETFSYMVSHDLRNPLTIVGGFAHSILCFWGDELPPDARYMLERIIASCERMNRLISALLGLAQLNRENLQWVEVDLTALSWTAVEDLRSLNPERQVEIRVQSGMIAQGDPRLLGVVMDNLLRNAWKFTGSRMAAQIEVGAQEKNGETLYYVRDNGVGFDPEDADKLFNPFQRLHPVHEYEGSGIGLSTVQRVIQRHGGHIWAESRVDEGATFWFVLGGR